MDVITFGSDRPPRGWPPRWLLAAGVAVLLLAGAGVALALHAQAQWAAGPRDEPPLAEGTPRHPTPPAPVEPTCAPVGWRQAPAVAQAPAGLFIDLPGTTLVRCDRSAEAGPWTVVVRRPEGSLGRHGAVITYPVDRPTVTPTGSGLLVFALGGAYARIRGDLTDAELRSVAAGTTVTAGRPVVAPPPGYAVVSSGPYRPPTLHETRYGTGAVGEAATLGNGLTYTAVTSGGGFEDQLYAAERTHDGGTVDGRQSVVSGVFGGNATLAWEPAPGVVAYVGYSGAELTDAAIQALRRLAARARAVSSARWWATGPQTIDMVIEPG